MSKPNKLHGARRATDIHAVVRTGEALLKKREALTHGEWQAWVDENFEPGRWTARLYMRCARAERRRPGTITSLHSVREANKAISAEKRGYMS